MQIETKFNVGNKLWFIDGQGKILEVIINSIDIKVSGKIPNHHFDYKTGIEYVLDLLQNQVILLLVYMKTNFTKQSKKLVKHG